MKLLNYWLYEIHRWVGIVLAVFMLVWIVSGVVIMYSTPMTPTRSQQLAHAENLLPDSSLLTLGQALEASKEQRQQAEARQTKTASSDTHNHKPVAAHNKQPAVIASARLLRSAGKPLWLIENTQGRIFAVSARDGSLHTTTPELAVKIAQNWVKASGGEAVQVNYLETVDNPVLLRNQENLRPFHRLSVGDDGLELLISERSGEVLHASSRMDRAFYWAGNWIHTFKPLTAIGLESIRHDVMTYAGLFAALASLTGLIIGWLRWRPGFGGKKTYSQGRTQPYRDFWYKWHFWSGLIGGIVILGWASSGFIETNPGKIFSQPNPGPEELSRFVGSELPDLNQSWNLSGLDTLESSKLVEISWRHLGKEAVLLATTREGQRLPMAATAAPSSGFGNAALTAAVQRLAVNNAVRHQELLTDYDSYYYPRHHQGLIEKPLPVLLLELDDAAATRFYLDPRDGRLLAKLDRSRRVYRWVYSGLHHWDFGWLYHRPIWDVWFLSWASFALVLATSSVVVGWQRLKKTFAPKKSAVPVRTAKLGDRLTSTE